MTWVVPHDFSYSQPQGVDFSLMTIFVEFYTTVLGFVLFRLYHNLNLQYPPSLSGTIQDFSTENEQEAVDDEVQKERVAGKEITKFFTGLNFIYSEKATKLCEISTLLLTGTIFLSYVCSVLSLM